MPTKLSKSHTSVRMPRRLDGLALFPALLFTSTAPAATRRRLKPRRNLRCLHPASTSRSVVIRNDSAEAWDLRILRKRPGFRTGTGSETNVDGKKITVLKSFALRNVVHRCTGTSGTAQRPFHMRDAAAPGTVDGIYSRKSFARPLSQMTKLRARIWRRIFS